MKPRTPAVTMPSFLALPVGRADAPKNPETLPGRTVCEHKIRAEFCPICKGKKS